MIQVLKHPGHQNGTLPAWGHSSVAASGTAGTTGHLTSKREARKEDGLRLGGLETRGLQEAQGVEKEGCSCHCKERGRQVAWVALLLGCHG